MRPRTVPLAPLVGRQRRRVPRSPVDGRGALAAAAARLSGGPTRSWWWNVRRCSRARGPSPSGMSSSAWKRSTRWRGSPGSTGRRRSTFSASPSRSSPAGPLRRNASRSREPRPSSIRSSSANSSPPTPRRSSSSSPTTGRWCRRRPTSPRPSSRRPKPRRQNTPVCRFQWASRALCRSGWNGCATAMPTNGSSSLSATA